MTHQDDPHFPTHPGFQKEHRHPEQHRRGPLRPAWAVPVPTDADRLPPPAPLDLRGHPPREQPRPMLVGYHSFPHFSTLFHTKGPCASSSATCPSWTRVPPRPECPGSGQALGGHPHHLSRTALGQVAAGLCLGLVACLPLAAVVGDCAVAVGVTLLAGTLWTAAFLWTVVPMMTPPLESSRGFSCELLALPKPACSDQRVPCAGRQCLTLRAPSACHGLLWDDPHGCAADAVHGGPRQGVPHGWITPHGGGSAPWHGHLHGRDAPSQDNPRLRPGHLRGPWRSHPHGEARHLQPVKQGREGAFRTVWGKGLTSEMQRRREKK